MTDVVVTDQSFGGVARERNLAERLGLSFADHQCSSEEQTVQAVSGSRVVFVNFAPITRRVLSCLQPGATVIRYGIGFDNVDIPAAKELGVRVCNVPDYGVSTVADHTLALILALLRRVVPFDRAVRERGWLNAGDLGSLPSFADTTIGLIGSGRIGRAVIERLKPFGFRILVHDPFVDDAELRATGVEPAGFADVVAQSHALTVHVPLTESTRHILNSDTFSQMRRGACVVNTARGGLIDERALADALRSGQVAAAALDVVENEPLADDSDLRAAPNLLLTPHAAFFSDGSLAALQELAVEEAERSLAGVALRSPVT